MPFNGCQLPATACAEEIARRQLELLKRHVLYLERNSPFYRQCFTEIGFCAGELQALEQLRDLPLTSKKQLAADNRAFLAVPEVAVVDVCTTSGTTGTPVVVWQTEGDLLRLAENECQAFIAAGVTPEDRVLVAAALDRGFMAGLAYFLGLRQLGAAVLRAGSSSLDYLREMLLLQRPQVLVGVPSLFLALGHHLQQAGPDLRQLGVRTLVCIGEPVRGEDLRLSALGTELQSCWGASVLGTYAGTEIATAFADCAVGACGGHLLPELALVEILDAAGAPVAAGEVGEVVVTPLGIEGTPLLRYRTGDLARLHHGPCVCGRITPRLGPIIGRREQMLKCRGTTLFPATITAALQELPAIRGHYLEVYSAHDLVDDVRVVVGCCDPQIRAEDISGLIAARSRVKLEVRVCSPEEVYRKTHPGHRRKPVTFFDYRHQRPSQ